jgi:ketosteroid isomerase-like protein
MTDGIERARVATVMQDITQAWLEAKFAALESNVHAGVVMVFPGFSGRSQGRDALIRGFREFCESATVHEFHQEDLQIDIIGRTAAVSYSYRMLYKRAGAQYRSSGRDLWIFQLEGDKWLATWRTMLDVQEDSV